MRTNATGTFDKTGLAEIYVIELTFSPEAVVFIVEGSGPQTSPQVDGMSIATALREQLGLKLESARGPSEVLVIESAALPTPD